MGSRKRRLYGTLVGKLRGGAWYREHVSVLSLSPKPLDLRLLSHETAILSLCPWFLDETAVLRGSSTTLNPVSPWLVDETNSLPLRGSSIDRRRTSFSSYLLEFIADWIISLSMGLRDSEGRLCLWRYLNPKVNILLFLQSCML